MRAVLFHIYPFPLFLPCIHFARCSGSRCSQFGWDVTHGKFLLPACITQLAAI